MNALDFAEAEQRVKRAARGHSLRPPYFKAPPETPGLDRSIRLVERAGTTSWIVAVRITDRDDADVIADMVDGTLAAADQAGYLADLDADARARLRAAMIRDVT